MLTMITLAGGGFAVGVMVTALIAARIIGMLHEDAARIVDAYGEGGSQNMWTPVMASREPPSNPDAADLPPDAVGAMPGDREGDG